MQLGDGNTSAPGRSSVLSFSGQAWIEPPIYEVMRTMPFNAQLASGSLSEARFKHYITQNTHYLIGFGRALKLAAR
jgi:thiaminase/transcriptional activator TenA